MVNEYLLISFCTRPSELESFCSEMEEGFRGSELPGLMCRLCVLVSVQRWLIECISLWVARKNEKLLEGAESLSGSRFIFLML